MNEHFSQPLVTVFGGAGYIGSVLVPLLLNEGYRVRVFDNLLYGDHGIERLDSSRVELIRGDICDTFAVSNACRNAEAVILLAAIVGRRANDINRTTMRDINFLASSVVLDAAVEHGASRFLFASTDSVYGVQSGIIYETTTPEPVTLYSRLKLRMEERVTSRKARGFHPVALRIPTCYGYSPRMRFDLVANSMIRDAVCKKLVTVLGGEQWRALVHVEDAARAFVSCLRAHENLISGEVFNVAAKSQNLQIRDLAKLVLEVRPDSDVRFEDAEPDLLDYHLSCAKIEKILDFEAKHSIRDALIDLAGRLERQEFGDPYRLKYQNT